jgi:acetyl esterase/lipase
MSGRNLESDGFAGKSLGFKPSYLPWWKRAERVAKKDGLKVQAAILSYGAFDFYEIASGGFETSNNIFWRLAKTKPRGIFGDGITVQDNPDYYKAVSPIYNIPQATDYQLPPQFVMVGSRDGVTTPESVKKYADAVAKAGHPVEFTLYEGRNHAFLDNGCNKHLGTCFDKDAPEALDDMLVFLNKILAP